MIYRLKDFFTSRLGHVTIFLIASIGLLVFLAGYFRKRQAAREEQIASDLPKLSDHALWTGPEASEPDGEEGAEQTFTHSEPNQSFAPFRPPAPKPAPVEPKPVSVAAAEIPSHVGAVFPLPPMILSERKVEPSPDNGPILLPKSEPKPPSLDAEEGALLHCELSAPVSSDQSDAPVLAQLTRPLIQRGRTLLPTGTSLSGSLERTEGNRVFLGSDWRVRLPSGAWVSITAHAQETALDKTGQHIASDGRAGLPTLVAPTPKKKNTLWKGALGTVAKAAGNFGQDRTRTAIGEFIPGTARNTLVRGSADLIEDFTSRPKERGTEQKNILKAEAGQRFYLVARP